MQTIIPIEQVICVKTIYHISDVRCEYSQEVCMKAQLDRFCQIWSYKPAAKIRFTRLIYLNSDEL